MDEDINNNVPFEFNGTQQNYSSIIKVIGVGGGGGNAVTHMYKTGIEDVTFVLCNTDRKALLRSEVPHKVQLGEGLGAGNRPEMGRQAAEENIDKIKELFSDNTKMVFITAGMGGGTGTGAGPVIAKVAKELDILTIGIVTIPFLFEGERKIMRAWEGVKEMERHVDSLLIINNENLRKIYADLDFINAFGKADDILTTAAKSIVEIITIDGLINLDFADVNTTLRNGRKAIMSTGYGSGENRVSKAIQDALTSPLLNDNEIYNAKKILFNLYFGNIKMKEMDEVSSFMSKFEREFDCKWGVTIDEALGDQVKIIILASGFKEEEHPTSDIQSDVDTMATITELYGKEAVKYIDAQGKQASYVILSVDEMDDDALLEMLDKSPTYKRDPQFATRLAIDRKSTADENNSETPQQPTRPDDTGTKIIF